MYISFIIKTNLKTLIMEEKLIVIFRMGKPEICTGEREIMTALVGSEIGKAGVMPTPAGMLYFAVTHTPPDRVAVLFKSAESPANKLPVIVFDNASDGAAINLESIMPFKRMLRDFKREIGWEDDLVDEDPGNVLEDNINFTLDFLLDKISAVGMSGLTETEKRALENLSK